MYVNTRATSIRDIMALNATSDPILIRARRQVMTQVSVTALTGIMSLGWTFVSETLSQNFHSMALTGSLTYIAYPSRKRHTTIPSKREKLTGGRSIVADVTSKRQNDQDRGNGIYSSIRIWQSLLQDPNEGITRSVIEGIVDVCHRKEHRNQEDQAHHSINPKTPDHSRGYCESCISGLFCHVSR